MLLDDFWDELKNIEEPSNVAYYLIAGLSRTYINPFSHSRSTWLEVFNYLLDKSEVSPSILLVRTVLCSLGIDGDTTQAEKLFVLLGLTSVCVEDFETILPISEATKSSLKHCRYMFNDNESISSIYSKYLIAVENDN